MWIALIYLCLFLGAYGHSAAAQSSAPDGPVANPGRPTVSTPATLTPVGYLQFETGALAANHSPEFSSSYSLNEVIKLSVAPRLELVASGVPVARFTIDGITANKVARVFRGTQAVPSPAEAPNPPVVASYFHRVYNGGAPDLDFGSPANSFLELA